MKLFSLPDGVINRKDRAQWLTPPFDLDTFALPVGSGFIVKATPRATVKASERLTIKASPRATVKAPRRADSTN